MAKCKALTGSAVKGLTVCTVLLLQELEYQPSISTYHIGVKVSDGVTTSTTSVTVNVVDINNHAPSFIRPEIPVTLSKSVAVGFSVATVTASDKDFGINANFK